MRWFAMASLFLKDPKVVHLGETHGPAAVSICVGLFGEAAIQEHGGRAEITYRNLGHDTFTDADTARTVVADAATVGLLALEEENDRSAVVRLLAWERHQAAYRKAKSRAEKTEPPPEVTGSHGVSRDVTDKTRQDKRGKQQQVGGKPADPPLCQLLAELVEKNTGRKPAIGKKWRDAERLLIERDQRDPAQAERLLRWSQRDEFWRGNILSMPKFRAQYDQLLLHAKRSQQGRKETKADTKTQDEQWAAEHFQDVPVAFVVAAAQTLRAGRHEVTVEAVRTRLVAQGRLSSNELKEAA